MEDAFLMLAVDFEKVKDQFREAALGDDVCFLHMVVRPHEFPRGVTQAQRIEVLTQALADDSISTTTAGKALKTSAKRARLLGRCSERVGYTEEQLAENIRFSGSVGACAPS